MSNPQSTPSQCSNADAKLVLTKIWDNARIEIPFDPKMEDETGYFEYYRFVTFRIGQVVRVQATNDRKIVLVSTAKGTIVLADRYPDDPTGPVVMCANPTITNELRYPAHLTREMMVAILQTASLDYETASGQSTGVA